MSNPQSPDAKVMILAGMPGSGKSTLLRKALIAKTQLFGASFDEFFQKTKIPPSDPEDNLNLDQRLTHGTWIHEVDLIKIHQRQLRVPNLVVHFEPFWYVGNSLARENSQELRSEVDFLKFLSDQARIANVLSEAFNLSPMIHSCWCIVNLKPPYDEIRQRWIEREVQLDRLKKSPPIRFLWDNVYNGSPEGFAIYENIYSAWFEAIKLARCRSW